jgi:hypothetical protein
MKAYDSLKFGVHHVTVAVLAQDTPHSDVMLAWSSQRPKSLFSAEETIGHKLTFQFEIDKNQF